MPHHVDFSKLNNAISDVKTLNVDVIGWKTPLTIEYVYMNQGIAELWWRVKGTTHTFTIPINELNAMSNGDYVTHFQQALTVFRSDLIDWATKGLKEEWQREYHYMFRAFLNV